MVNTFEYFGSWDKPFGDIPEKKTPEKFVIHSLPMPSWMVEDFNKIQKVYQESLNPEHIPYIQKSIEEYAKCWGIYLITKFVYQNLFTSLQETLKYSHQIVGNEDKTLSFIRHEKKYPGVLEQMRLHYNLDL